MNSKEIREQRSKLVADAQALLPKEAKDITSEIRTKFEALMADASGLAEMAKTLETEERNAAEQRGQRLQLADIGEHAENKEERAAQERASFRSYLKTGVAETRDLTVSADGVLIPTSVAAPVVAKLSPGSIYSVVGKISTSTGSPIKVPTWNDTANGFVLNSTSITTTDPTVSLGATLAVDDYRSNPLLLDNSLVQDAGFDLEGRVVNDISLRYQRDVSKAITIGNSSNVAALTSITAGITTATTATVAYADFVKLMSALDPAYQINACWTMSNATLGAVLSIVDSNNRPIFLPYMTGTNSGFTGSLFGYAVKINQYLPAVATANVAVQFGDFEQGYMLREVLPGVVVRRLTERYAELNRTGYVAFCRFGGVVTDAGTHPILSMTIK